MHQDQDTHSISQCIHLTPQPRDPKNDFTSFVSAFPPLNPGFGP